MAQLKLYGENAFTFLFFNEINSGEEKLKKRKLEKLLENLKRFDEPKTTFLKSEPTFFDAAALDQKNESEIWLFPSFGKRSGFGEPDALLLVRDHVFWFEVETYFDLGLRSDKSEANDSLRQLYRFHCAARAFARSARRKDGHLVIEGRTITNEDKCRDARLRLRGHGAAGLLGRLKTACATGNSHYILLSVHQPSGGAANFHESLRTRASKAFNDWDTILKWPSAHEHLNIERCWYTYWHGDLKRFLDENDPLAAYVGIKKGS